MQLVFQTSFSYFKWVDEKRNYISGNSDLNNCYTLNLSKIRPHLRFELRLTYTTMISGLDCVSFSLAFGLKIGVCDMENVFLGIHLRIKSITKFSPSAAKPVHPPPPVGNTILTRSGREHSHGSFSRTTTKGRSKRATRPLLRANLTLNKILYRYSRLCKDA